MSSPRLYLPTTGPNNALTEGAQLKLPAETAHYLTQVLRLGVGAEVRAFNAEAGEWTCTVALIGKRGVSLNCQTRLRPPQAVPQLTLLFAPLKRTTTDWLVEKATELGATHLQPVFTQRTVAETVRLDRLVSIAREAAEQCERLDVPTIAAPARLDQVISRWPETAPLFMADETQDARATPMLAALDKAGSGPHAVLIGPEGGFTPAERTYLHQVPGLVPVSLGPFILRAETAAAAALALMVAHRDRADDQAG